MYNGYSKDEVTESGAGENAILNFKHGIITRGVLMDMARHIQRKVTNSKIEPRDEWNL